MFFADSETAAHYFLEKGERLRNFLLNYTVTCHLLKGKRVVLKTAKCQEVLDKEIKKKIKNCLLFCGWLGFFFLVPCQ